MEDEALKLKRKEYRRLHSKEISEYNKTYSATHRAERTEINKKYRADNLDIIKLKKKEYEATPVGRQKHNKDSNNYYKRNKPVIQIKRKAYRDMPENKRKRFYAAVMRSFGLSEDVYNKMIIRQSGRCDICNEQFGNTKNAPHIDHCHKTNKVRGLLCINCNLSLGRFRDSPKLLASAIVYLVNNHGKDILNG